MGRASEYNSKRNKSVRERLISYDLTHMWNLRNKINRQRKKGRGREETKKQTLNYREQAVSYQRGGMREIGMRIKEYTYRAEKMTEKKIYVPLCSLKHYLQLLRYGSNIKCLLTDEWIKKLWYIYTV